MAKMHVAALQKFKGRILLSGMIFEFETQAVSVGEASNNGVAQYSRKLNMSILALRRHMKDNRASTSIGLVEET